VSLPISLLRSNSIDSFLFQKPAEDRDVMKEVAKTHEAIQYVGMNTGNGFSYTNNVSLMLKQWTNLGFILSTEF
jgi:hypothetical protein